ncbi:MAG: hypothetical protein R3338_02645 [Thermoanaerobaculia bacterium]|nr:hypothetical protein [Thermoanaerobaculia bacterium]
MSHPLVSYLDARADSYEMTPRDEVIRSIESSHRIRDLLPNPYLIYGLDESREPSSGFPIAVSQVIDQVEEHLSSWIEREIEAVAGVTGAKDAAREIFRSYSRYVLKIVENAMMSNFLADYHAIFWLVHSGQLSRHFSSIPRQLVRHDASLGRDQGASVLYRVYNRWSTTMRKGMEQIAERLAPLLDGEERRNVEAFELLQKNVLIFTAPKINGDLTEIRAYVNGYLRQDANQLLGDLDAILDQARILARESETFRYTVGRFDVDPNEIDRRSLLDRTFRDYLFHHPEVVARVDDDARKRIDSLYIQIVEWDIIRRLRDGIVWMKRSESGDVVDAESPEILYSRSTRPIDFGRVGVLDPIVHRFGLVYDLSSFSQTLGEIARGGVKKEINSYRQMFLFQKKLDSITDRHLLKFEKFLGDGAFYTTRRAMRLVKAAIEMQALYEELKSRGFAFDKGLRIALNYGYYRLLPLGGQSTSEQPLVEFYGPGIVELSRLTTGKSTQAIADVQQFLITHGYNEKEVTRFFAPVMRRTSEDLEEASDREYYAYMDPNGNLVNEGIVASLSLVEQLTIELREAKIRELMAISCPWGDYVGFDPEIEGVEAVGFRLLGQVALKGLDKVEVAEIVPVTGPCETEKIESDEGLLSLLRQQYLDEMANGHPDTKRPPTLEEPLAAGEGIAICSVGNGDDSLVMLGRWSHASDTLKKPVRLDGSDLQQLLGIEHPLKAESIETRKHSLRDLYRKLAEHEVRPPIPLDPLRQRPNFQAFLLGDEVEEMA